MMQVSRTWQARLRWLRGQTGRAGSIVVVAAAIFGGGSGLQGLLGTGSPDFPAIAQRVGNQQDQVGAFACGLRDHVADRAPRDQRPVLQRFITLADNTVTLPTTPAAVVTTPQVVLVIHTGDGGRCRVVRGHHLGQRTPVRLRRGDPRVLPGTGVDVELSAPCAGVACPDQRPRPRRRLQDHLPPSTQRRQPGLRRGERIHPDLSNRHHRVWTAMWSPIPCWPRWGDIKAQSSPPRRARIAPCPTTAPPVDGNPCAGRPSRRRRHSLPTSIWCYPLTLKNSGGTWMVAAIDLTPQIVGETEPNPYRRHRIAEIRRQ